MLKKGELRCQGLEECGRSALILCLTILTMSNVELVMPR